jgi:5-methyltetrahydrofolate--homocysteine methyltransferase
MTSFVDAFSRDGTVADYPRYTRGKDSCTAYLSKLFQERIVMYDGAMGTMIQKHKLEEAEYRGERFKDYNMLVRGNNDLLSLTQPAIIRQIHLEYLESGSDIIGTNTFSSTTIAQADYGMEDLVYELNYESARLAKSACDEMTARDPSRPRFVAGSIGPTNRTASISPSVEDPSFRNVTFDELVDAYYFETKALVEGGSDIIIVETIFDTLNAKAAVFAVRKYLRETDQEVSVLFTSNNKRYNSGVAYNICAGVLSLFTQRVQCHPVYTYDHCMCWLLYGRALTVCLCLLQ